MEFELCRDLADPRFNIELISLSFWKQQTEMYYLSIKYLCSVFEVHFIV